MAQQTKWNVETIKELIKDCKNRNEVKHKYPYVYSLCLKNKWMDLVSINLDPPQLKNNLTFDMIKLIAEKCESRSEFKHKHSAAYQTCKRNGWLEEIHKLVPCLKDKTIYTKKMCKEIISDVYSIKELQEKNYKVYKTILKNGWKTELCSHFIPIGNRLNRCIYVYIFPDNSAYVGLTYNIKLRNIAHITNYNYITDDDDVKSAVLEHIKLTGLSPELTQLTEYIPVEKAIELEETYYQQYKNNGFIMLNKAPTGNIGGNYLKWSYEELKIIAFGYNHKKDFERGNKNAYQAARKRDYFDEICAHMTPKVRKADKWNKIYCKEIADNYNDFKKFKEEQEYCYKVIMKNGWYDELCGHLHKNKPNGFWKIKENCRLEASKYKNKWEFQNKNSGAYCSSLTNGWLDEFFPK